jgi:curli biogenesis system outer membrane secretion channel CsgG
MYKFPKHLASIGLLALLFAVQAPGGGAYAQFGDFGERDTDLFNAPAEDENKEQSETPAKSGGGDASMTTEEGDRFSLLTAPIGRVKGPKRTVAVGKFDAIGSFSERYGDWDIGNGLAAIMTTALVESDRFIVLERAHLQKILTEHELKAKGVSSGTATPRLGQLAGVQLMIFGAVTEFGDADESSGTGLSIGGGSNVLGGLLGGAVSRETASGSFAMDFRIVDTTTGQVLQTYTVREALESTGYGVSIGFEDVGLGTRRFYKTPLGQAVRRAITKAVQQIATKANDVAWAGRGVFFGNVRRLFRGVFRRIGFLQVEFRCRHRCWFSA